MTQLLVTETAEAVGPVLNRKADELAFRPSLETTLGVELELMIVDRETGDLAPGAVRILKACAEEGLEGVSAELMQSMLEVKTGICRNVTEVREQLVPTLKRVRNIASSMGHDLALAATHPFHRTNNSVVSPGERYERILDRLAWMIHQRVVFGLHVHVGMPSGDMAIGVINVLVQHLPHLLALSANSPFWQGIDSGLASCRAALYRSLPHAGVPRYFAKWKDFRTFLRVMRDCKAIQSPKDIYWDIRPRPEFGTIEFRVCNMPPTLATTLSIVALIRSLVVATQRLLEERPHLRRGDMRRHWIAVENKWLANREERETWAETLVGVAHNAAIVAIVLWGGTMLLSELGVNVGLVMGGAAVVGLAVAFVAGGERRVGDVPPDVRHVAEHHHFVHPPLVGGERDPTSKAPTADRKKTPDPFAPEPFAPEPHVEENLQEVRAARRLHDVLRVLGADRPVLDSFHPLGITSSSFLSLAGPFFGVSAQAQIRCERRRSRCRLPHGRRVATLRSTQ